MRAVRDMPRPVTLEEIKANPKLKDMVLVNNSRLSVQPVSEAEWKIVCAMGGTEPRRETKRGGGRDELSGCQLAGGAAGNHRVDGAGRGVVYGAFKAMAGRDRQDGRRDQGPVGRGRDPVHLERADAARDGLFPRAPDAAHRGRGDHRQYGDRGDTP